MRQLIAVLILALSTTSALVAQTPRDTTPSVIRAGRLFDSEAGTFLPAREILVRGGKIVQVAERVERAAGARVVDLTAYTVLPGPIDAHTHLLYLEQIGSSLTMEGLKALVNEGLPLRTLHGAARARTFLEAGITTVRDLGNSGRFGDVALQQAIDDGSVDGPRMIVAGPGLSPIGGQFPGLKPGYESLAADEYRIIRNPADAADAAHATNVNSIEHGYEVADSTLALMARKGVTLTPTDIDSVSIVKYLTLQNPGAPDPPPGQANGYLARGRSQAATAINRVRFVVKEGTVYVGRR